jgi:hypothetical protein
MLIEQVSEILFSVNSVTIISSVNIHCSADILKLHMNKKLLTVEILTPK